MRVNLSKGFKIGFIAAMVLFISSIVISYQCIKELVYLNKEIKNSQEYLLGLEGIISGIKDGEAANRGFALTNDSTFLDSYLGSFDRLQIQYQKLLNHSKADQFEAILLRSFKNLIDKKFQVVSERIEKQRNKINSGDRENLLSIREGKKIMDEIMVIKDKIKNREEAKLQKYVEKANFDSTVVPFLILVASFLSIIINVTILFIINTVTGKQQKTQGLLQESEEKFKVLLESAPDSIVICSSSGLIELVNSQAEMMFGYKSKELIGKKLEVLMPEEYRHRHVKKVEKYLENPHPRALGNGIDLNGLRKNGKTFPVEISLSPIYLKNGTLVAAAIRDVTERKNSEVELRNAIQKAEAANLMKTRFVANMSHEIRTPISSILGFAEILKQQVRNDVQLEYLNHITASGDILLKLIGNILDMSKIEEGKFEIDNKCFNFREVIMASLKPYKYTANEKGLNFSILIDKTIPEYLIGDSSLIIQIIINLIGNAIKFTKEGGIGISFQLLNKPDGAEKAIIKVSVDDTGIGIPKEKQSRIFETFTQADSTIYKQFGGSGLGLSIVKKMIEILGSEIEIISPSNVPTYVGGPGSTFVFTLSLEVPGKEEIEKMNADLKKNMDSLLTHDVKVLLVEDNEVLQKLGRAILEHMGCKVEIAVNGQNALELFEKDTFSIIFMDIQMPVMDGITATRLIRKVNTDVPIIGLTANVSKEEIERYLAEGMNAFIGKPYSDVQIFDMIKKFVVIQPEAAFPATAANNKVTNFNYLMEMTNGDFDLIKEIIEAFYVQENDFSSNVDLWMKHKEYDKISSASHKLFSTAGVIGNEHLKEALHKLEKIAHSKKEVDQIPALIETVKEMCLQSFTELKSELETYNQS
jgi:PAS domain S-box-containing protein